MTFDFGIIDIEQDVDIYSDTQNWKISLGNHYENQVYVLLKSMKLEPLDMFNQTHETLKKLKIRSSL